MNDLIEQLRYRPVATTAAQMREAADCMEVQQRELNAAQARITQLEQALRELVRLKDLKGRIQLTWNDLPHGTFASREEFDVAEEDYITNKPLAWQAARQALEHSAQAPKSAPDRASSEGGTQ